MSNSAAPANVDDSPFNIFELPIEIFFEIMLWAQLAWTEEVFVVHAPDLNVKRLSSGNRGEVSRETCCHGIERSKIPGCLRSSKLAVAPSPAHAMSQSGRGVREALLLPNSSIWGLDNTFYKSLSERSGRQIPPVVPNTAGNLVAYRARTLVAVNVCSHLIGGIAQFYPTLERAKIGIPFGAPDDASESAESLLWSLHDEMNSAIKHFDLEIYRSPLETERPLIIGLRCNALLTSHCRNARCFLYSTSLTSLCLEIPFGRHPRFGANFFSSLSVCGPTLEYFTLDAGDCSFVQHHAAHVVMPVLRFLRVVLPEREGSGFLRRLTLPDAVDMHVEAVVDWRRAFSRTRSGVRQLDFDASVPDWNRLWRYAAALWSPRQTEGVFGDYNALQSNGGGLWSLLTTAALDIRLDPSTLPGERACSRFPEYISLSLASSTTDMISFLESTGFGCAQSLPSEGKSNGVRRSLAVRDGIVKFAERELLLNRTVAKPVYDTVEHLAKSVILPRARYPGRPDIRELVVHQDSFMPTYTLGWHSVLDQFIELRTLVILCPGLDEGREFTENMEGCLVPVHWRSLAAYLNEGITATWCPSPELQKIRLPRYAPAPESPQALTRSLNALFNSRKRLDLGCHRIVVSLSLTDA